MNENVEIVKDFGVPSRSKYPFDKLAVGEAFTTDDVTKYQQLRSAASRQGKALKRKFSVRLIKDDEARGTKKSKKPTKIAVVRIK